MAPNRVLSLALVASAVAVLAGTVAANYAPFVVKVSWDGPAVDAACKAAKAGKYIYAGKMDMLYSYGTSGAEQGTLLPSLDVAAGKWETMSLQLPTNADDPTVLAAAKNELSACCVPSNPDSGLGNKYRCIPNGPKIELTIAVIRQGPPTSGTSAAAGASVTSGASDPVTSSAPDASASVAGSTASSASGPAPTVSSGASGYPLCPSDKTMEYQNILPSGVKLWGYAGTTAGAYWVKCAGCVGGGEPAWEKEWATGKCSGGSAGPAPSGAPTTPSVAAVVPPSASASGSPVAPPSTTGSGTAPTGSTSAYPLCPADVVMTYVSKTAAGKFVWKPTDGVECSGCPGEGYQTTWDAVKKTCVTKNAL